MTQPDVARSFLHGEIQALEPFGFVAVRPAGNPLHAIEVTRGESGALELRVPARLPVVPELPVRVRSALRERGFTSEDPANPARPWVCGVADPDAAVDLVQRVLSEVFDQKADVALDVVHGSHRAEHEAKIKLATARERIERVLQQILERRAEQDADGDYLVPKGDVRVTVAPRAVPGGPVVVRIFAICTVGVTVDPNLGLFLARLNFGLMFGRFALDAEHSAIWFDETLLGDQFSDEELRFTIDVVANTADEWDDRLKQMFGGITYQEALAQRGENGAPRIKPGQGLYL